MEIRDNLLYTKDHEWVIVEGDIAHVGITDFAQKELGDIVFLEIETVGQDLAQGAVFGTVEAVKTVSDLYMPVSGQVLEINEEIADHPELVNKSPYDAGWLINIRMSDSSELASLLTPEQYKELIA